MEAGSNLAGDAMCEWKNSPNWFKELVGLLLSGILLFTLLSIVLCHLKVPDKVNVDDGQILSMPSTINTPSISLNVQHIQTPKEESNAVAYFDPADAATMLGPYLEKLGWIDILILVFIWPIGMVFVRFSKSFSKRVYKWML